MSRRRSPAIRSKPVDDREKLKLVALGIAGLVAAWFAFVIGWCTMWKIYIDIPVLFVLSNAVTGITSCITTILVGRTLAQLNQGADTETTMTQTTETITKPKPPPPPPIQGEMVVTKQPEVAVVGDPPIDK